MPTKTVTLDDARIQLSKLVDEAAAGLEIVIAVAGVPRARLMPFEKRMEPRRPGGWEGRIWISDDFDDQLPAEAVIWV